ncbi:MAG: serine O-acetyltransferase [Rhizobiaceae bacterium]|nr:serine O-acetyltransferase [Hyphomicrobiales bacterium]NRB31232.1 serine O-acetyltransferase [Rhizobiaceae bacterium]
MVSEVSAVKGSKSADQGVVQLDPVWVKLREEAQAIIDNDPAMGSFVFGNVLNQRTLEDAIFHRICERLHTPEFPAAMIRDVFNEMRTDWPEWSEIVRVDVAAVYDRDPACTRFIEPILYFKGFHAIQTHRLANWSWKKGRKDFALYLQSRSSQVFQTDINPTSELGRGIFMDHATGIVIGATAVIGDDVSILQGVTLGGTGKEEGDRHPKVKNGVLIGAGAIVLGNIEVGACSRVAAGALVVKPVPPKTTVAGVPARVVGVAGCSQPSRTMDQILADDK